MNHTVYIQFLFKKESSIIITKIIDIPIVNFEVCHIIGIEGFLCDVLHYSSTVLVLLNRKKSLLCDQWWKDKIYKAIKENGWSLAWDLSNELQK